MWHRQTDSILLGPNWVLRCRLNTLPTSLKTTRHSQIHPPPLLQALQASWCISVDCETAQMGLIQSHLKNFKKPSGGSKISSHYFHKVFSKCTFSKQFINVLFTHATSLHISLHIFPQYAKKRKQYTIII